MQRLVILFQHTKEKIKTIWHHDTLSLEVLACRKRLVDKMIERRPESLVNFFNEEFIVDPLISDTGNVYDSSSINEWLREHDTLPLTGMPYRTGELVEAPELKIVLNGYKRDQDGMLKEIASLQSISDEKMLNSSVDRYAIRVKLHEEKFEIARREAIQKNIKTMKNKLFLDSGNIHHLDYWREETSCNLSLVTFRCGEGTVKISPQVRDILQVANRDYIRVSDFRDAIEQAQQKKSSCWLRLWGTTQKARQVMHKDFLDSNIASSQSDWGQSLARSSLSDFR